jgi:hypothetical protein
LMNVTNEIHDLAALPQEKNQDTQWLGNLVGPSDVYDILQKGKNLLPCQDSNTRLSRP